MPYKFLLSPWKNEFIDVLGKTKEELFISSPFINVEGVKILSEAMETNASIEISLITSLTTKNIVNGITEPVALLELYKQFDKVRISSLGRLHAKVYLIDNKIGIITSANLTRGGLINNFEYGVLIDDENLISNIKEDMLKYRSLGNILDKSLLEKINEEANEIYRIKNETDEIIKKTQLANLLRKSAEKLDVDLLKNRIRGGKTINAIFSETILYLLEKKGALRTDELHLLIQAIHPDICDDSVDRVLSLIHI